jgi:hypothetical protein
MKKINFNKKPRYGKYLQVIKAITAPLKYIITYLSAYYNTTMGEDYAKNSEKSVQVSWSLCQKKSDFNNFLIKPLQDLRHQ